MQAYLAKYGAFEYEMQLVVSWHKDTRAHMDQARAFLMTQGYDPHHSPVSPRREEAGGASTLLF